MKLLSKIYTVAVIVLIGLVGSFLCQQRAGTTGGAKDETPPKVTKQHL
jgi:hypothetical protein